MTSHSQVAILGGTSLVATFLMPRLSPQGWQIIVAARRSIAVAPGCRLVDFASLPASLAALPGPVTIISLLPLPILVETLPDLGPVKAVVALGSTSRFSKAHSADPAECASARTLEDAETALAAWSHLTQTPFTLLRPTLVYDLDRDRNLARMARVIRRFGVLPLARPASGLRQPIHADDVAKAIIGAIDNPAAANQSFNIAGGERLTYRSMVERVFKAVGRSPRFLMLPTDLLRFAFRAAGWLGLLREKTFGSSVFQRMNEDLVYDVEDGLRVLQYDPRPFEPVPPPARGDRLRETP